MAPKATKIPKDPRRWFAAHYFIFSVHIHSGVRMEELPPPPPFPSSLVWPEKGWLCCLLGVTMAGFLLRRSWFLVGPLRIGQSSLDLFSLLLLEKFLETVKHPLESLVHQKILFYKWRKTWKLIKIFFYLSDLLL